MCARVVLLIKLQAQASNSIKKETLAQVFPVNFAKFDRTPFFKEHLWLLLLNPDKSFKSFSFCSLSSRSKLQKQSPKGVLQKYALKIFSKYTKIYLRRIFLIIKVQSDGLYIIKKRVSSICVISQINVFLERL